MNKRSLLAIGVSCLLLYSCSDDSTGSSAAKSGGDDIVVQSECGNSIIENGEICDDGNKNGGDGCSSDCKTVEEWYVCPSAGVPCRKNGVNPPNPGPTCGNKALDADEACDDGNQTGGDGCSADCSTVEEDYICNRVGRPCIRKGCGNSVIDDGEECDDGPESNVEYTKENLSICGPDCKWAHYCGDSKLDDVDLANGEECDNGGIDTSNERNGCSADCKRVNYCGDGHVDADGGEACDDGNVESGDGCSADCQNETGFSCIIEYGKSVCTSIACGNGTLETDKGEACDDGNRVSGDGCSANCQNEKGYRCTQNGEGKTVCEFVCGNGVLNEDAGELCDDHNTTSGDGCSDLCAAEAGWICPDAGKPCIAKACGDGILVGNEECDDGNTADGDGCSFRCKVEKGWLCTPSGCIEGRCGDGIVQTGEQCDNDVVDSGKPASGDGCDATCHIESGYECRIDGGDCRATICGDGSILPSDGYVSYEQCDLGEGNNTAEHGCNPDCTIAAGFHCNETGSWCMEGKCGDGLIEAGEDCDDANHLPADGCSPDCKFETGIECAGDQCKPVCGDGVTMWMLDPSIAEECDDGNLINGDGCSSECKIEKGYTCTDFTSGNAPEFISLPVTYRDFRSTGRDTPETAGTNDGFITTEHIARYPDTHWDSSRIGTTIYDFDSQAGCPGGGYTLPDLDEDRKPVLAADGIGRCFSSRAEFAMWYRNTEGLNREVKHRLYLWLTNAASKRYFFTSETPTLNGAPNVCADGQPLETNYFLPLATSGYGITAGSNFAERHANYSFTSEISTYFQYKGGESLDFSGDDDLWVFLNGHIFVDLGGLHGVERGTGTLSAIEYKDSDGKPVLKEDGTPLLYDPTFNVYEGGIYEIKLFHAERNATGSNFSLTLTNFLNSGTATCDAVCGDGLIRGSEECDYPGIDTNVDLQHEKGCSADCRLAAFCGNNKIEKGEQCDSTEDWCQNCMLTDGECGNGIREGHERCDKDNGVGPGQKCLDNCQISGCGDGIIDADNGEICDDGNTSDDDMCTSSCTIPKCGDSIVQTWLGEVCDDGINDGSYGNCGLGCGYMPPRCGDGTVDKAEGEQCDDGFNTGAYGTCNADCTLPAYCGDGIKQPEFEDCDDGELNGQPDKCARDCKKQAN